MSVLSNEKFYTIPLGMRLLATNFRNNSGAQILGLSIATMQYIEIDKKTIRWVKLTDLRVADQSSDFAALRQFEVYGFDPA